VAAWMTLACGVSVFAVWIPAESFAVLVVFSLVSGGILGGECTTMPRDFRLRFL
jgi:hypothetical protein